MRVEGLDCNFRKYPGYSKKGRDIFGILFIWWKGLFWNIIKERVSFAKRLERVGGLFKE